MKEQVEEEVKIRPIKRSGVKFRQIQMLMKKYNYKCISCGVTNDIAPLEMAFILPISEGGDFDEENFTILCPSCHRSLDRKPREHEFISFLSELINNNKSYSNIKIDPILGKQTRYRADLIVDRQLLKSKENLLIECKSYLTMDSVENTIYQLKKYKEEYGDCQMVVAVPSTLKDKELNIFTANDIEVWDLGYLIHNFKLQISNASPSYYKTLFLTQIARSSKCTREEELIGSLEKCLPGRSDCYVYQSLVGDILEHLFTPPLDRPISEISDKSKTNRRDFIIPNYSDKGFWVFMREKYCADYIVVDAKNYTGKVKKTEILQMANYLKSYGAGLFGIIFSRQGGDSAGCEHTLREQWLINKKMIIVLNDDDIIEMLIAKSDGRSAEDILGRKIEQFRLSM